MTARRRVTLFLLGVLSIHAAVAAIGCRPAQRSPESPATEPRAASTFEEPGPVPGATDGVDRRIAISYFEEGEPLMRTSKRAGDCEHALPYFVKSIAVFLNYSSMKSAALCLAHFHREDEALEMYEALLRQFAGQLTPEDQRKRGPFIAQLRKPCGRVVVSSKLGGYLMIDRRPRGQLPKGAAIPVLSGKHVLRIFKEGYEPFERSIDVVAGELLVLQADLEPLVSRGRLRVEEPDALGSDLFIDGDAAGTLPWEGTLRSGRHSVWTRFHSRGSSFFSTVVVEGQTTLLHVDSAELGPTVRIDVEPPGAALSIDGVGVGFAPFEARLPTGHHAVRAAARGHVEQTLTLDVPAKDAGPVRRRIVLAIEPDPSRRPGPWRPPITLSAIVGLNFGTGLNSSGENACRQGKSCTRDTPVWGAVAGLRAGLGLGSGLSLEGTAAYSTFWTSFLERVCLSGGQVARCPNDPDDYYRLGHQIQIQSFLAAVGLGQEVEVSPGISFLGRLSGGLLFAWARDSVIVRYHDRFPLTVQGGVNWLESRMPFVAPELGIRAKWGAVSVGVALATAFFPEAGDPFDRTVIGNPRACAKGSDPAATACGSDSDALAANTPYGPFMLWMPQVFLQLDP